VAQAGGEGKLRFLVNLQSSQYLNGWFFLNTYLQRQLGRDISLEPVHGALGRQDVDITAMEMVFAKPFEAARLLLECRFRPLLRPAGQADEVAVLARADDARARLGDFAGARAVTASADSFVYLLGRFLLDEGGVPSSGLEYDFAGNETKAMQRLFHGEADLLFMLAENFNGLSSHTTRRLKVLDQSDTGFAFHLLCLAPSHAALAKPMTDCLQEMRGSSQGRQVLEDIGVESWAPPAREEVEMLAMLYRRYVGADGVTLAA
jgi:ABC-type phosphate/phosphonate transport system substrate-binding protein